MANKNTPPPETTEVALRDGGTAVVTAEFAASYPALVPDESTLELLEENLGADGENLGIGNLKRVKVPSGELDAWMIKRGGKSEAADEIRGVLVAWKARRSFWVGAEPDGSAPDCSSTNNRTPEPGGLYSPEGERAAQNPGGTCRTCPMAQFGSDPKGGRGAACREQRMLFLVVPDALFPIVVNIPRTSIRGVTEFMMDLMDARKKYYEAEVALRLVKTRNKGGQEFNQVEMSLVRYLEPGEAEAAKLYGGQIKMMIDRVVSTFDADSVTEDGDGGISVAPEEMPA